MNSQRRREINDIVEFIRKKAKLNSQLSYENLEKFVQDIGGELEIKPLQYDIDGMIEKTDGGFVISLNAGKTVTEERKKFTLAHELGHLFLHMDFLDAEKWDNSKDYQDSVYARNGYSEEEYDAHEFAAALLMPEDEFKTIVYRNNNHGICDITKVAEYFGVSTQAASNRGKWLGVFAW